MSKRVCVLGLGYIGLPTASVVASRGYEVVGVDTAEHVVQTVAAGLVHIVEPDLETVVRATVLSGRLTTSTKPVKADIFVIAVPTPIQADKTADLSYVESAVRSVAPVVEGGNLVIVESTVPPGTTEKLVVPILAESGLEIGAELFVAYCPERVIPGRILRELIQNDRVVGGINTESALKAREFYESFVSGSVLMTSDETAEMVKLVENAFRDVNIAFANELSQICDCLGINVWDVIELANRHPRVNILRPGPGVGGHCIAVDPWFLLEKAPEAAALIAAARKVNDAMPTHVVSKVESVVPAGSTVACLGATYKADVDDTRESPAVEVITRLRDKGYMVEVVDPYISKLNGFSMVSVEEALDNADCLVLLVDHSEFRHLQIGELSRRFGGRVIDTRGIWNCSNPAVSIRQLTVAQQYEP